jgi:hypothetical protein
MRASAPLKARGTLRGRLLRTKTVKATVQRPRACNSLLCSALPRSGATRLRFALLLWIRHQQLIERQTNSIGQVRRIIQANRCLAVLKLRDKWLGKPGNSAHLALGLAGRLAGGLKIPSEDNALLWHGLLTSGPFFSSSGPFRHSPRWPLTWSWSAILRRASRSGRAGIIAGRSTAGQRSPIRSAAP